VKIVGTTSVNGSILLLALGITSLTGCGASARPLVVDDASAMLARQESKDLASRRPRLMKEAKASLEAAQTAADRGEEETAVLQANIAMAKWQTAKNFVAREQSRAMKRVIRNGEDDSPAAAPAHEVSPAAGRDATEPAAEGARQAVRRAEDTRADVLERAEPGDRELARADGVLESARKSVDEHDYDRAVERANEARRSYAAMGKGRGALAKAPEASSADGSALRTVAEARIVDLQLRRTELIGTKVDTACGAPFREFEATLDLAQKRLDARDYTRALEIAVRAGERLRACDPGRAAHAGAADPDKTRPAVDALKKSAAAEVQKAQDLQARLQITHPDDPRLAQPSQTLKRAEEWYDRASYEQSQQLARQAQIQFTAIAATKAQGNASKAPPDGPCGEQKQIVDETRQLLAAQHTKPGDANKAADKLLDDAEAKIHVKDCKKAEELATKARALVAPNDTGAAGTPPAIDEGPPWRRAYDRTQKAIAARDAAKRTDDNKRDYDKADAALGEAKAAYAEKKYAEAEKAAERAIAGFGALSGDGPAIADGKRTERNDEKDKTVKADRSPVVQEGIVVEVPKGGVEGGWGSAYQRVSEALAMRDRATLVATEDDRPVLTRAERELSVARGAWKAKDYPAAESHASAATASFGTITRAARARAAKNSIKDAAEQARAVDAALRDAKVALELCGQQTCEDRAPALYAQGKQLVESAQRAADAKDGPYAIELAKQATAKLNDALAKPRQNAPVDPKLIEKQRHEAEAAQQEAEIQRSLCTSRGCETVDQEAWLRAGRTLDQANKLFASKSYEPSKAMFEKTTEGMKTMLDSLRKFRIPSNVTRVALDGNRLTLAPTPEFTNGTAKLTAASKDGVTDLATVLKANKDAVKVVTVTGYTDSAGDPKRNIALSLQRAKTIVNQLVASGVPAGLLAADGKGAENPVADNSTPQGRATNRRVEIVLEQK
jgi:outer membrane protein OmpA-like peptidoglycan-associated protein